MRGEGDITRKGRRDCGQRTSYGNICERRQRIRQSRSSNVIGIAEKCGICKYKVSIKININFMIRERGDTSSLPRYHTCVHIFLLLASVLNHYAVGFGVKYCENGESYVR